MKLKKWTSEQGLLFSNLFMLFSKGFFKEGEKTSINDSFLVQKIIFQDRKKIIKKIIIKIIKKIIKKIII